jgi:expansin (peptidoglycan-binding protein)
VIRSICAIAVVLFGAAASHAAQSEAGCPCGAWAGTGEAAFHEAFSEPNAFSLPVSPDQYVVAVAEAAFDGSAVCGRCLRVAGPLGTIVARITDYCVGAGCRDLDLSPNAFAAIGDPNDGIIPISWESVSCDVAGPIAFYIDPASNPFYAKIQLRNYRYGIAGLSISAGGGPYVPLQRATYNAFEYSPGSQILAPLSFRVTDRHGALLEETGIGFVPGSQLPGAGQFALCPEVPSSLGGALALTALRALRGFRSH